MTKDKTDDLARSINIEQVRSLQGLFATTPSLSPRRAVVIDSIDDLERNAANALLKNLEEPPAGTVFFLVSHVPGRLLATIRSRCRLLRFGKLSDDQMTLALQRLLPDEPRDEIETLVAVGGGSPGRALGFAGLDIGAIDQAIDPAGGRGRPDQRGALVDRQAARHQGRAGRATRPISTAFRRGSPLRRGVAKEQRWRTR